MAFALLFIGILLLVSSVRNTQGNLAALFKIDFTGNGNFVYWVIALIVVGVIGYIQKLKPLSDALLVLIILTLFLSRGNPNSVGGGFFQQFLQAVGYSNAGGGSGPGINTSGVNFNPTGGGSIGVILPPIIIGGGSGSGNVGDGFAGGGGISCDPIIDPFCYYDPATGRSSEL